ncbi:hypothetical protein DFH08DRAFT_616068, partial [Mycena albidolilacea]
RPHVLALDRIRTWSSPYAKEHQHHLLVVLPASEFDKAYAAVIGGLAPKTHENYAAGLLRFHQYCDTHHISEGTRMPAPHFLLTAFIADWIGRVGGGTVKSWMSGLKAWHDINGAPWDGDNRWVELARRTANKEGTAFKREQRGPVTMQHLVALRSQLHIHTPFDAAIWATACATFWGCRRLGETTVPSLADFNPKFHATRAAVVKAITTPDGTKAAAIPLPWTKSTRERGGLLTIMGRDDELCPLKAFSNHLLVNAAVPADAPLFAFQAPDGTWAPLTKTWFMKRCTQIWDAAGILRAFGHSFHIGGSTELLLAGVSPDIVAALGGWTSLAFLLYWRKIEHIVPMHVGKAYDKAKLDEVAKAFEAFRVAHNI